MVLELVAFVLVEEVMFFYSHGKIYKYMHRKHQEWTASIAYNSLYAHAIKHFLMNLFPVFLGPFICESHIAATSTYVQVFNHALVTQLCETDFFSMIFRLVMVHVSVIQHTKC